SSSQPSASSSFRGLGALRHDDHGSPITRRLRPPSRNPCVVGHRCPCVARHRGGCDVRHSSSSGRSIGSGRGVHAPQNSASSTTSARTTSGDRYSSSTKGWVCTWSSQIPRPQNLHEPTAVRRQCQQSIVPPEVVL